MTESVTLTDDEIRALAKARVGFKAHALVYVMVNLLLNVIWAVTGGLESPTLAEYWPVWSLIGWGIGLGAHAFGVYGGGPSTLRREEEKLRRKYGRAP